ncbi:PA2169 family four-helix-bundle protein [Sphingobacterium oryzagri]|uniref:PA2169 family four-helix-bundle protein n=1 Tax=Sphingobacterium oryzagri TaxID=3025669 RepID=A0ABY7WGU9_9SPHI|nr:PA2169 family four-helix-bundle protein [Sphingobacterium sp. KACC 22765]WDF67839.1 PA2169 family four-helix-bundle protein [Sphingobacterium sp. KACC 22765]
MGNLAVLNELVEINNDRVAGFEKAIADLSDENIDLKAVFQRYTEQSHNFSQELSAVIARHGGEVETGTSVSSSLHRAWIDVKALFGGTDRVSILDEAERGEDAIKAAYKAALDHGELQGDALALVMKQALAIKEGHDEIKLLRDTAKAIN